jgi:hypothetical protein
MKPWTQSPLSAWLIPFSLFLLALLIRLGVILFARFDGLYGQDAFAYLDYTRQLIAHNLTGPIYWPLGYPLVAALFALLLRNPVSAGQAVSVILGSAIVPLGYGMVRELLPDNDQGRHAPGLFAAVILLFCGQLLQSSIVLMSDATALFWATFSAYLLLRYARTHATPLLPLASIALALAIITRFLFIGLILPFGLYALFALGPLPLAPRSDPSLATFHLPPSASVVRRPSSVAQSRRYPSGCGPWSLVLGLSSFVFLLILLPQLYFSQTSAAPIFSHAWLINWHPLNAFRTTFDNPDGHFDYRLPPAVFYAEPAFHPFYLFPLLTPFIFLGAWKLRRSRALILLGGWILVLYISLIGIPYENFRFGLAYFPPLALLAALGLHTFSFKTISRFTLHASRLTLSPRHLVTLSLPSFTLFLSILLSLPFISRGLSSFLSIKSRELAATHYLQTQIPAHSIVLTFGLTLTLDHYTDFDVVELFNQSPETLPPLLCTSAASYLFVEGDNLESQWVNKAPDINFRWLRAEMGLKEIGRQDSWTLYEVEKRSCGISSA